MLVKHKISLTELSKKVGVTIANLSILKQGHARAIRFSTIEEICKALDCQSGDILEYKAKENFKHQIPNKFKAALTKTYFGLSLKVKCLKN